MKIVGKMFLFFSYLQRMVEGISLVEGVGFYSIKKSNFISRAHTF